MFQSLVSFRKTNDPQKIIGEMTTIDGIEQWRAVTHTFFSNLGVTDNDCALYLKQSFEAVKKVFLYSHFHHH